MMKPLPLGLLLLALPLSTVAGKNPSPIVPVIGTINVTQALYGAGGGSSSSVCDATEAVGSICDGLYTCGVLASNILCGNPAQGIIKGLSVNYSCGGVGKTAYAVEGEIAKLWCAPKADDGKS